MPIPKPKPNETVSRFITRCMADETMKREYEDNSQRAAICYREYRENKKKSK